MFLVPRQNAQIDNVLISNLWRVAPDSSYKQITSIESMDSSKFSWSRNAVLLVYRTTPTSRVCGWFVWDRMQRIRDAKTKIEQCLAEVTEWYGKTQLKLNRDNYLQNNETICLLIFHSESWWTSGCVEAIRTEPRSHA